MQAEAQMGGRGTGPKLMPMQSAPPLLLNPPASAAQPKEPAAFPAWY